MRGDADPHLSPRRAAAACLALVLAAGCGGAPQVKPPTVGPRMRVAVVEFENKTAYGARLGTAASDILATELAGTDRFILIEREKLGQVLKEQGLGMTGALDPDTVAKAGRVLGAQAIVTGAVSQFGVRQTGSDFLIAESKRQTAAATVDVRIVDAETAQVLDAQSGSGEASTASGSVLGLGSSARYDETLEGEALRAAVRQLAGRISDRLAAVPWTCHVAQVDGGVIYLDAGRRSGLNPGQALAIVRLGEEIKSPASGVVIGRKETPLGHAKVTGWFGEDGATAEMTDGPAPARGDLARL